MSGFILASANTLALWKLSCGEVNDLLQSADKCSLSMYVCIPCFSSFEITDLTLQFLSEMTWKFYSVDMLRAVQIP